MASGVTRPATPAAVGNAEKLSDLATSATVLPAHAELTGDARIPPGTMVAERYRIDRVLGEGGMGVVYAAEHALMRKEVALKVLHAEMCAMPEVVARFEREAIAAAHIDHPNVAAATDFGRLPDGSCYLVLELLRGVSLREEIAKGPMPLPRALMILRGVVSGVAAAHAKGVVHRDLKPENVMLVTRDGTSDFVKVLDFGIAKIDPAAVAESGSVGKALTRLGTVFGTPEYMAPEQAVGDAVDARADLYALGVIFLEMLMGKCPFSGTAISILRERVLSQTPPDMSGVPAPAVRAVITKLLARSPADRTATATELLAAIDTLAGSEHAEAPRPEAAKPVSTRSRFTLPIVAAVATLTGAGLLVLAVAGAAREKTDEPGRTETTTATSVDPATSVADHSDVAPEADAPPTASATPATPTASARTTSRPKTAPPPRRGQAAPRRTGPGGIYVPPPKDWFR